MRPNTLHYSPEVKDAIDNGYPIVALESTLITHGMPYPHNLETAQDLERIVREHGAVPATIAILNGEVKIGLSEAELERLASSGHAVKVSRRDLPYAVSKKLDGGTTVASTMILAELAGIRVFVTGGIGGVHREAQQTMDISADLQELAVTSVAVVTSGPKSILDLGLTLEYLETMGVPVIGYQTDDFPAFYARTSGFKVDGRVDTPEEAAAMMAAKWDQLGLKGSLLINNPVPEAFALEEAYMEDMIGKAIVEAKQLHITGKSVTPFLLKRVKEHTDGKSLTTAMELIKDNARVGASIAIAYCELEAGNSAAKGAGIR